MQAKFTAEGKSGLLAFRDCMNSEICEIFEKDEEFVQIAYKNAPLPDNLLPNNAEFSDYVVNCCQSDNCNRAVRRR